MQYRFFKMKLKKIFFTFFILLPLAAFPGNQSDSLLLNADLYYNKGIYLGKAGKPDSALYFTLKAVSIYETQFPLDSVKLAYAYQSLGIIQKLLGKYNQALQWYNKSEEIYKLKKDENMLASIYINKANIFSTQQDFDKALEYNFIAKNIYLTDSTQFKKQLTLVYNNIGTTFNRKNDTYNAIKFLNLSLSLKKGDLKAHSTKGNLATCYEKTGNLIMAKKMYRESIHDAEDLYGDYNINTALHYINYGNFLLNHYNLKDSALFYLNLAKESYIRALGGKHPNLSTVYNNLGEFYKKTNQYDSALAYIQKSLMALSPDFNTYDYSLNPDPEKVLSKPHLLRSLKNKADILFLLAKNKNSAALYESSLNSYDLAIQTIHLIRSGFISEESKLILAESQFNTFDDAIGICYTLYEKTKDRLFLEKAFAYSEQSKSAILTEAIKNHQALQIGNIPDSIIKQEKEIEKNIWNYEELIYEENKKKNPDQNKINYYSRYLFEQKQLKESLIKNLEKNYANYYILKYTESKLNIYDIQKLLTKNDKFIEYFFGEEYIYIFLIGKKQEMITCVAADSSFNNKISYLLFSLSNHNFSGHRFSDFNRFKEASYAVYQKLLEPFKNETNNKNLIIVPDGLLAYLPFEILVGSNQEYNRINYKSLDYQLYHNTFQYAISASFAFGGQPKFKKAKHKLVAFAPSYNNINDTLPEKYAVRQQYREKLYPLKGIKKEAEAISKLVGGHKYLDKDASEENFKKIAADYDILHLAMHTLIDDYDPMYSKMAFEQSNNGLEDGFLNTYELYNMKLNSRMAVLSSCNSGAGKLHRGEGVISLARGFIYAGCPSIVMTLWTVEDMSGVKLMKSFYGYLKKGNNKSKALQQSKIDFIENADQLKAHPYFWAGYVIIGNNQPLFYIRDFIICFIIFLVVFIPVIVYRKRLF